MAKKITSISKWQVCAQWLKHHRLISALGVLAILILCGVVLNFVSTQIAIRDQQTRFDKIHVVMADFETSVKKALGANLTDIKEYDSCYLLEQNETPFPGPDGVRYCGIELQGATNLPATDSARHDGGWSMVTSINEIALMSIRKTGLNANSSGFSPGAAPQDGRAMSYDNFFYIYGNQSVRCDVTGSRPYSPNQASVISVGPDQLYFTFQCEQKASKNFFKFIP